MTLFVALHCLFGQTQLFALRNVKICLVSSVHHDLSGLVGFSFEVSSLIERVIPTAATSFMVFALYPASALARAN